MKTRLPKNVCQFRVQGEFVTNLARNLWAEGAAAKAVHLLVEGIHGITEGIALEILTGRKRLSGWNSRIRLLSDDAKTDNRGLPLTPSLTEALKKNEQRLREAERETAQIAGTCRDLMDEIEGKRITTTRWHRAVVPEEKPKPPKSTTKFKDWDCGWLAPDGAFYGCRYFEHIAMSYRIDPDGGEAALEEKGWIKLQKWSWWNPYKMRERGGKLTQAQLDTLFDWHRELGRKMEDWMKEELA